MMFYFDYFWKKRKENKKRPGFEINDYTTNNPMKALQIKSRKEIQIQVY